MPMTATITEIALPTAESIAALFREHDIIPEQLVYLDTSGSCPKCRACAIGILLVEIRGNAAEARADCRRSNRSVKQALKAESSLPSSFVDGLDDGFSHSDGGELADDHIDKCNRLYIKGYCVGWRAWGLAKAGAGVLAEERP